MEKNCAVVSGDEIFDIRISPGTTVREVLTQLHLPQDFIISPKGDSPFGNDEELYGKVSNGEKLYASPAADVGFFTSTLQVFSCV